MEARPGVEPGWADLQSAALPLCYRAEIELADGVGGGSSSSRAKYSRRRRGYSPLQSPVLLTIHRKEKSIDEWRSAGESNPWLPPGQGGTLATELAERKKRKRRKAGKPSRIRTLDPGIKTRCLGPLGEGPAKIGWRARKDSNLQPLGLESSALPVELHTHKKKRKRKDGLGGRI